MTGSAVAPATMTCWAGSSVSSAAETTNDDVAVASSSASLMVGSATTSFSNCSSGRSGSSFLPSGPSCSTAVTAAGAAAFLAAAFLAGAFFAGAFLAAPVSAAGSASAAAFFAVAVAVLRVLVAAAARVSTGSATLSPRELRWDSSALRWRGSTPADSLARRTCSGLKVPEAVASSIKREDGGVGKHLGGDLACVRGHEHLS